MKAILEFDLDDIDDTTRHKTMLQADIVKGLLFDFDQILRSVIKYQDYSKLIIPEGVEVDIETVEIIRDLLFNLLHEEFISLDD